MNWIKVTDRFPEDENEHYLVTVRSVDFADFNASHGVIAPLVYDTIYVANVDTTRKKWFVLADDIEEKTDDHIDIVTAWMPLPVEPYEGE